MLFLASGHAACVAASDGVSAAAAAAGAALCCGGAGRVAGNRAGCGASSAARCAVASGAQCRSKRKPYYIGFRLRRGRRASRRVINISRFLR